MVTPGDRLRRYLSGDVLETLQDFFGRQAGRLYLALYELDDVELEQLILDEAERISLILSNTGLGQDEGDEVEDKVWDARNAPVRRRLVERAARRGARFELQHRLFNNSIQIGHNKFAVWVDGQNRPRSVITGSTDWTWSGHRAVEQPRAHRP